MKPHIKQVLSNEQVLALGSSDEFATLLRKLIAEVVDAQEHSYTKQEFCELERISVPTYHKLQKNGYGPEEVRFPGMTFVRITQQARREWHENNKKLKHNEKLNLDQQRRTAQTSAAGTKGAAKRKS